MRCCLLPRTRSFQQVKYHKLICAPSPKDVLEKTDSFGNARRDLTFARPLQRVEISSVMKITVQAARAEAGENGTHPLWCDLFEEQEREDILSEARKFGADIFLTGCDLEKAIGALSTKIYEQFTYDPTATGVDTALTWLFQERRGVCQDFARVMIAILQAYGLDTRYVSGYLFTTGRMTDTVHEPASHAWVSVNVPDVGWRDVDPTNDRWVDENYITLAWGRDYVDVIPLQGILEMECGQRMGVSVTIERQAGTVEI